MSFLNFLKRNKDKGIAFTPHRDWLVVIATTAILFAIIVLYNVYIFREIVKGEFMLDTVEEVIVKTVDKEALQNTYIFIQTKKRNLENILDGNADIRDPSL